jgi:hypothetical protein
MDAIRDLILNAIAGPIVDLENELEEEDGPLTDDDRQAVLALVYDAHNSLQVALDLLAEGE